MVKQREGKEERVRKTVRHQDTSRHLRTDEKDDCDVCNVQQSAKDGPQFCHPVDIDVSSQPSERS